MHSSMAGRSRAHETSSEAPSASASLEDYRVTGGGTPPPVTIFAWLWQAVLLFAQPGPAETVPRGLWGQLCSLLSSSPGSVILDEVIDGRQPDRGFGGGTDRLSVVRAQPSGQVGRGSV